MKKFLAVLLAVLTAAALLTGCNLVASDESNVVVAKVNGKPILKSEYINLYNYYYQMYYQYYGESAASMMSGMEEQFLDQLVNNEIIRQHAEADGYLNYTDEQRAEAQKTVDEQRESYISTLIENYKTAMKGKTVNGKNEGESDEDFFRRMATAEYEKYLANNKTSEAEMLEDVLLDNALQKYQEDKVKDVTVSDGDVVDEYDKRFEEQKTAMADEATFVSSYNSGTYSPHLFFYPGYARVSYLLVAFEEADKTALTAEIKTRDDFRAELDENEENLAALNNGEVVEPDGDEPAPTVESCTARIEELKTKIEAANAKIDGMVKTAAEKTQAKADEIYASVKDADEEAFNKAVAEKTDDTSMKTEDAAKEGVLIGPKTDFPAPAIEAAKSLEEGKISEPVATEDGFYILRKIENLPEEKIAFDKVSEEIKTTMTENKKTEQWTSMVEGWTKELEDTGKLKTYTDRL